MASTMRFQLRRDTPERWESINPILFAGEPGVVLGTDGVQRLKIGDGQTAWNDLPYVESPSSGSTEKMFVKDLTATDIVNKYIELPDDCDSEQAITVVLANVSMTRGTDWELQERDAPVPDLIRWNGLSMDRLVRVGDKVTVTYYKK